jgi:hypothetical protein
MREPKSLAEWLESKGNPKHHIAKGDNGSMVIAIEDKTALSPGVTLYNFREEDLPNGQKHFWMSSGWGINMEQLPALRSLLNNEMADDLPEPEMLKYNVMEWRDDDEGEYEAVIEVIECVSDYHAKAKLRDGITRNKYPKGSWLEYTLNGKKILLDTKGRIA